MTSWVVWSVSPTRASHIPESYICIYMYVYPPLTPLLGPWLCAMFRVVWICLVASGSKGSECSADGSLAKSSGAKVFPAHSPALLTWPTHPVSHWPTNLTHLPTDSWQGYKSQDVRRFFFLINGILLKYNCGLPLQCSQANHIMKATNFNYGHYNKSKAATIMARTKPNAFWPKLI